ncbi:choice-of-anchor A family protein [Polymorphobacter sp. PAMC 29334]|uniref:collagen-binding domain-containing protein n=1 Tax=Polymorphobacter sp. PAMC 29334 TaxID=2862331 RepID=UPI001C778647|nr:collagen-binding domain-containing protein [Polymorphobacter sp. PAMC 29334]QYE33969.1 choice-of-anchor A family protein [Polymorphobacter sp. PAMC 29334]
MTYRIAAAVALMALTPGAALATGSAVNGLTALGDLNLIVLGNMTGGHDVEGKTFVGGNISGGTSTYGIGRSNQGEGMSSYATLTVGGDINGGNFNNGPNGGSGTIAARKSVDIGGSFTGGNFNVEGAIVRAGSNLASFNINGGTDVSYGGIANGFMNTFPTKDASLAPGGAHDLHSSIATQTATLTADLGALSTALYALSASGSSFDGSDHNNAKLIARDPNHLGYAVITIDSTNLTSFLDASNLLYDLPSNGSGGYLTTIINVTGASSYTLNANSNNSIYNPYILWNFGTATSITLNKQFNGSLLAPFATVSNSTPIEGSLAAQTFHQGGEVHLGTFNPDGRLFTALTPPPPVVGGVPEPMVWAQMVAGFGLIGLLRRRRATVAA